MTKTVGDVGCKKSSSRRLECLPEAAETAKTKRVTTKG